MRVVRRCSRRAGLRLLVAAGAIATAACDDGDAVVDVTADGRVYHVAFVPEVGEVPGGAFEMTLEDYVFNLAIPDAFERQTGPLGLYQIMATPFGPGAAFDVGGGVRNATSDRRAPVLVPSSAASPFFGLFSPNFNADFLVPAVGPGWWNLLGIVTGLKPNTAYTVVLARMALEVRGEVDHAMVLTAQADPPDSLYYLGGAPAGNSATVQCTFTQGVPVTAEANPVAIGFVITDPNGIAQIDCLPVAFGSSPWWREPSSPLPPGATDSLPFGTNAPGSVLAPGQYNYVLLFEGQGAPGNPIPPGAPTVRAQVGPDIDAQGNVIWNAYAPYPAGPLSTTELVELPGFVSASPAELSVTLSGLPELYGAGLYKLWLVNGEDPSKSPVPAVGEITIEAGGQVLPGGTFATWKGDIDASATFHVTDATLGGGARVRDYTYLALSVEPTGDAAQPSQPALWTRYVDNAQNRFFISGPLSLGRFRLDAPSQSSAYSASGTIRGSFFRDTLVVSAEGVTPPPGGFHFELWMTQADGGPRYVAPLAVDDRGIGATRIPEALVGSFFDYTGVLVTLEPNDAPAVPSPARIFLSENWNDKFLSLRVRE